MMNKIRSIDRYLSHWYLRRIKQEGIPSPAKEANAEKCRNVLSHYPWEPDVISALVVIVILAGEYFFRLSVWIFIPYLMAFTFIARIWSLEVYVDYSMRLDELKAERNKVME
jgi:hypothetical protein